MEKLSGNLRTTAMVLVACFVDLSSFARTFSFSSYDPVTRLEQRVAKDSEEYLRSTNMTSGASPGTNYSLAYGHRSHSFGRLITRLLIIARGTRTRITVARFLRFCFYVATWLDVVRLVVEIRQCGKLWSKECK